VFLLQAWHLDLAAFPQSDEGVYAHAGRMLLAGQTPHTDFGLWHMPLLPALLGAGLAAFGTMYPLRLLSALAVCLSALPLDAALVRLGGAGAGGGAALLAVLLYLTDPSVMHHDARFPALRPLANAILVLFLWLGVRRGPTGATGSRAVLAALAGLLFLPALVDLLLVGGALALGAPAEERRPALARGALIALAGVLPVAGYFLAVPQSFREVVVDQLARPPVGVPARLAILSRAGTGLLFPAVGTAGLVLAALVRPALRPLAVALLGVVAVALLGSRGFYAHYVGAAAPAFAVGAWALLLVLGEGGARAGAAGAAVGTLVAAAHLRQAAPLLVGEWRSNVAPGYRALVEALSTAPEPVLTAQPILAVEARRALVPGTDPLHARPPGLRVPLDADTLRAWADRACTIVLEDRAARLVPPALQLEWRRRYRTTFAGRWGILLLTGSEGCPPSEAPAPGG
jgi:hypothetical protein